MSFEELGGTGEAADFFVPDFQRVDAQGRVTYEFPGGVLIDAATGVGTPAPTDRAVSWKRISSGAVVAQVIGVDRASDVQAFLQSQAQDATQNAYGRVEATSTAGKRAHLQVSANGPSASAPNYCVAYAGADQQLAMLLDSTGASDFLQSTTVLAGAASVESGSFTLSHPGSFLLLWGATGYIGSGSGLITGQFRIDNTAVSNVPFYFNVANQHLFIGLGAGLIDLAAGAHTWQFSHPGLAFDSNDFITAVLIG